jgi:hypothetical protein
LAIIHLLSLDRIRGDWTSQDPGGLHVFSLSLLCNASNYVVTTKRAYCTSGLTAFDGKAMYSDHSFFARGN